MKSGWEEGPQLKAPCNEASVFVLIIILINQHNVTDPHGAKLYLVYKANPLLCGRNQHLTANDKEGRLIVPMSSKSVNRNMFEYVHMCVTTEKRNIWEMCIFFICLLSKGCVQDQLNNWHRFNMMIIFVQWILQGKQGIFQPAIIYLDICS